MDVNVGSTVRTHGVGGFQEDKCPHAVEASNLVTAGAHLMALASV